MIILDGWGISRYWPISGQSVGVPEGAGRDAIASAETPVYDQLLADAAVGRLRTDGPTVGLPAGAMGNSMVGHLTIGAGRVIKQELTRINEAIATDSLDSIAPLRQLAEHLRGTDNRLHVWGLLSDGGVHASDQHIRALIEWGAREDLEVVTHIVTDGRDTPPRCARRFLVPLQRTIDRVGTGTIATVSGRYYAMDRDENWQRTRRAYEAMVYGRGTRVVSAAEKAIEAGYTVGQSDEFIEPTVIRDTSAIEPGDGVLLANFRADRARQLTRMLGDIEPDWPFHTDPPGMQLVTMAEYDETFDVPACFAPVEPETPLGAVLADSGLTQLRIAESEKYPHVTYFLNGGREHRYPGELREIIKSPAVATYDRQPEMAASEVTDRAIERIGTDDPDVLVLNYANPDMVGHTGDFLAACQAVEAVDTELGRLLEATEGAHRLITADHGNAEDMGTPEEPHTAHTTNPVPLCYLSPAGDDGNQHIREGGTLADLAPTLLELVGLRPPAEMTGRSLLR